MIDRTPMLNRMFKPTCVFIENLRQTGVELPTQYDGQKKFTPEEVEAYADLLKAKAKEARAADAKPKYVSFENSFITDSNLLPYGYDTIVGYLAKNDPDQLRSLRDPVADTARDGFACKHKTERRGYTVRKVPAPPALRARGITELNAYPKAILEMRLAA